ncbi:MAG TPA: NrfD/PsrC family molybdoenzyme membrane anchor subunit [Actinomadura sp.]|jgi:hypothetical protein|nr:NrfD/PsrC family molybdoenzyme membrane anchor subunit [Actinomadura sp.]
MTDPDLTREGPSAGRPPREARMWEKGGRRPRLWRSRELTAPDSDSRSYYGKPIIKRPGWKPLDIAGYLFLGGLAGASSVMAAAADGTGRPRLARVAKIGSLVSITLSGVALVHDLGRPERFLNMLRVVKPTSPMSIGSWILTIYAPGAGVAVITDVTGWFPWIGRAATAWAALTGPAVLSYTAVLICNTAVPSWHAAYREMPFLFAGSALGAAAGLGMLAAPPEETDLARGAAVIGAAVELATLYQMHRRLGPLFVPYRRGRPGALMRASEVLTVAGTLAAVTIGRRNRLCGMLAGTALIVASACTRFGVFEAGIVSASEAKYTVMYQRLRPSDAG